MGLFDPIRATLPCGVCGSSVKGRGHGWNGWNLWNVWNGLRLYLIGAVERFELSVAVERLERFEPASV